jgi:hypothetical protein
MQTKAKTAGLADTVAGHKLTRLLFNANRPLLTHIADNLSKNRDRLQEFQEENRRNATSAQKYAVTAMRSINAITLGCQRVEQARALLNASPNGLRSRAARLPRDSWTEYHFAFWTVALASTLDLSLIATAQLLELGFPPRLCTMDIVTHHEFVGSPISKALRALSATLEEHKQRRHRFLHRGETADFGELTDPDFLLDLRSITFASRLDATFVDKAFIRSAWAHALRELRPHLDKATAAVRDRLVTILDALASPVGQKLTTYAAMDSLLEHKGAENK